MIKAVLFITTIRFVSDSICKTDNIVLIKSVFSFSKAISVVFTG